MLTAIAAEEADRLKVVQLDVDTNPETTARYGVLSMPTLMVFRDGEPVKSMVGARPKRRLLQELEDVSDGQCRAEALGSRHPAVAPPCARRAAHVGRRAAPAQPT